MNNDQAAKRLRSLASEFREAAKTAHTWADLPGSSEHLSARTAMLIHATVKAGCVPGISPTVASVFASPVAGWLNWYAVRKTAGVDSIQWIAEFDRLEPPERWRSVYETVPWSPDWRRDDDDDDHHDDHDDDQPSDPPAVDVEREVIPYSADERRAWYRRQCLARADLLETVADRIEAAGETAEAVDPADVETIAKKLTGNKPAIFRYLCRNPSGVTFAEFCAATDSNGYRLTESENFVSVAAMLRRFSGDLECHGWTVTAAVRANLIKAERLA